MAIALLKDYLNGLHPLVPEVAEVFTSRWQSVIFKRKSILTAAGETEKYLYFVVEGVQRVFYLGDENKEATIVFTYPPSFSGVADSFLTQTPSFYFLETITASRFLRIAYDEVQQLIKTYPSIQQLFFKATSFALKGALERHIELQCYTNEEKFRTLFKRSPHILNLVPHKYLASYLGIDATNFSKLLATVRLQKILANTKNQSFSLFHLCIINNTNNEVQQHRFTRFPAGRCTGDSFAGPSTSAYFCSSSAAKTITQ
jgi:CRP-like cAMP-binding protein